MTDMKEMTAVKETIGVNEQIMIRIAIGITKKIVVPAADQNQDRDHVVVQQTHALININTIVVQLKNHRKVLCRFSYLR